jgi:hypothetical protein
MGNKLFKDDVRMALIIAASLYDDEEYMSLPWAEKDAQDMKVFLEEQGFTVDITLDDTLEDIKARYDKMYEVSKS